MSLLSEEICHTFRKVTGKHSYGAKGVGYNTTVTSCQAKCLQLAAKCLAFEFNHEDNSCWVHDNIQNIGALYENPNIDQYVKEDSSCACKL